MRKQFNSQRHEWIVRFVRENRQMANRKLYREDVLQMLFADSDSEGEYLPFGNDDWPSNDRASPGTSLQRNGAAMQGERVHEAQTSDHLTLCPKGMGVAGVDVVVVSMESCWSLSSRSAVDRWAHGAPLAPRRGADDRPDCVFFSDRARSTGRQYRCSQCGVGLPYSQEL